MAFLAKVLVSALVIAGASELAKRSTWAAAVLASLPLTSFMAIIWLYLETGDAVKVRELSFGIGWAVLPSLLFFALFYFLMKYEVRFWASLSIACIAMVGAYAFFVAIMRKFGVNV